MEQQAKSVTYASACAAYGAWLGSMLERHARGLRPVARVTDERAVEQYAKSFGVAWPSSIERRFPAGEEWRHWLPHHEPAIDSLVLRVAETARGWRYEDDFLAMLLGNCPCTPPAALVNHIIDHGLSMSILLVGHCSLEDPELWRLVDLVGEAGETLALRRYCDPSESVDRLAEVFYQLGWPGGASWLAYQSSYAPSSREKAELVAKHLIDRAAASGEALRIHPRWQPMVLEAIARLRQ